MESYYNIHDKIKIKASGRDKFVKYLDNALSYFKCDEIGDVNINLMLGSFTDKKSEGMVYFKDRYKIVTWRVLIDFNNGLDSLNIKFNGNFLSNHFLFLYILQPSIRFLSLGKGMTPFHSSAVSKNNEAYVFSAFKGTGKTSTLLNALSDGYIYLADDLCFIGGGKVYSFPTPIHLYSYNLKNVPYIKKKLTISKRFEFFIKSSIFKISNGYASFPTGYYPYNTLEHIPNQVPLKKIINLLKKPEENIIDFLVMTNKFEMFRFLDYLNSYDSKVVEDYTKKLRSSYEDVKDKMVDFVVGRDYGENTYGMIKRIMYED